MIKFDRKIYFDAVREKPFGGELTQEQVNGQEAILTLWEASPLGDDLRWLAYPLATTYHETAATMQPIEEYGHGKGYEYGQPDPETGEAYYGRGFVQLTWRDNYQRATDELELDGDDDLVWHPEQALNLMIAAEIMFRGMWEGWFRPPHRLDKYFNEIANDPVGARNIINADVSTMGEKIAGYHAAFLTALKASAMPEPVPEPEPPTQPVTITLTIAIKVDGVAPEAVSINLLPPA